MRSSWWQISAVRADLERALADLNALRLAPPLGDTAYYCDLCEALIGLLETAARCTVVPEDNTTIRELRRQLDHQLETTVCISRPAIETVEDAAAVIVAALLDNPQHKLAIYGTLAPGEVNHEQVADIGGQWVDGFVRGDLHFTGWGADHGFPALTWRPDGSEVPVKILCAKDLPRYWPRLDDFEGAGYCRILVPVEDPRGIHSVANLYADRGMGVAP